MNSSKYKDALYEHRKIADMHDLINSSIDMFGERAAYLVKKVPGGPYEPISYNQVRENMSGLGTALLDMGLGGKKIAIIGENRYEWVLTYMAVVCSGSVVVPLDRELRAEEISSLLDRAEVAAVVFSSKVEKDVEEAAESYGKLDFLISMDAPEHAGMKKSLSKLIEHGNQLIKEEQRYFFDVSSNPNDLCAILFTSGTTGMSKGVMLSQKNISANVYNMSKYVDVSDDFVGLSVLPMHHTYEMTCHIFTAFYQGCAVAICEGLKYIVKNMAESQASVMLAVPLIFENMHKKVWKNAEQKGKADKMRKAVQISKLLGGQNKKSTKKLFKEVHQAMGGNMRLLIAGGAAIDPSVIEDFNAMGLPMIQGYGMTENAPIIAVNKDRYSKPASVGLPMPGTEIKIVEKDENGIGEIICRGDSVMLGYYNDPEETAKVIVDGWLHTGDYGYFDKDGFLYVTGRKKNIIVTKNGKNISPEEVEYYLSKSPYIEEVVVWGKDGDKSGDTIICADIFPDNEYINEKHNNLDREMLKTILKNEIDKANEKMPLYKRVKRFHIRDEEFEKTTTRKIKRHAIDHGQG